MSGCLAGGRCPEDLENKVYARSLSQDTVVSLFLPPRVEHVGV